MTPRRPRWPCASRSRGRSPPPSSPSHAELLWWACDAADKLTPLSQAEEAELARRSEGIAPIFPH